MIVLPAITVAFLTSPSLGEVHSPSYLGLSATEKAQRIWKNCEDTKTSGEWLSSLDLLGELMLKSMCPSFFTPGDELPDIKNVTRKKAIHTVGTVGRVEWRNLGGHNYTGIFQGAQHGIIRPSLAMEPNEEKLKTVPGFGLKFLRDGIDSANLVAMYSVNGQESWNFFKNDFSNHIPEIDLTSIALAAKFSTATRNIRQVGLSDWGLYGEDGTKVTNPLFPYKLRFRPTGEFWFSETYVRPVNEDLVAIPSGSTLYQVYAQDKPTELGGTETRIADLVLVSEMITSLWGDQGLFFRHQDMAEDLTMRPEWNEFTPQFGFFKKSPTRPSPCH